ncbi:hypothetical protein ABZT16_46135 [Streptomyces flaveolus]
MSSIRMPGNPLSLTDRIEDLGGRTRITQATPTGTLLEIHLPLRAHP